jgi:hypothetical protein
MHAPGVSAGTGMSLKHRAHRSELYGYPIPRRPITFDLRHEPGAGKPHAGIYAGCALQVRSARSVGTGGERATASGDPVGEEQSSSLPRPSAKRADCDAANKSGVSLELVISPASLLLQG